jgi:hypothetical protein
MLPTMRPQMAQVGMKAFEILIPNGEAATRWMTMPHPDQQFGGGSPLEWILAKGVSGLVDVRRHLEA